MNDNAAPVRVMNIIARLNIGGPAIHVTMLTERLGPPTYESCLVCGLIEPGEGDMSYFARQEGIEPIIIPELGRALHPLRDLVSTWRLYRLIREWQPDVVHTHTSKAGFVGRLAAWLAGVPVIVHTFHGHVFRGYFGPLKTRFFIWLERIAARMADTIIALNDGQRRDLTDIFHITRKGHVTVLPLGLNLDSFAQAPRKTGVFRSAYGIPQDVYLVGIVGRIVHIKNHPLFLRSAALLRQKLPNVHFVVVGDGDMRPEIEAMVDALGLRAVTTFTGWLKDLTTVYADMDALVISSINEGTPISVIEALSAGCPVVATQVGGLPDLLGYGDLGQLVPPEDAEALASALAEALCNPPDTRRIQQTMLDRYGIERLVRDMDSLYQGLLAKKKRPPKH